MRVETIKFQRIVASALESLVEDEALYSGLEDRECTLLLEWAQGHLVWIASKCPNEIVARADVEREYDRLRLAFKAIARAMKNVTGCDRAVAVCVTMQVLSELWNV